MPALVNMRVGSFLITMGAEGTTWWFLDSKKLRNLDLISLEVIIYIENYYYYLIEGEKIF